MTNAEVGSIRFTDTSRFITFRVPRQAMKQRVPDLELAVARCIPANNVAMKLLVEYLVDARATQALQMPDLQHLTATHVQDLLAIALGATRDATLVAYGRGVRAARLRSAKAFVVNQLHRCDLSVELIAAYLGVTSRYIHILFETEDLSLWQFILTERLLRARRLLTDPRINDRTISDIAFGVGFKDLSHFNRTFRRRFAQTPSDVRRDAERS